MARRSVFVSGLDRDPQINLLFRELLSRPETETERLAIRQFLDEETAKRSGGAAVANAPTPLQLLCHLMLSLNELSSLE